MLTALQRVVWTPTSAPLAAEAAVPTPLRFPQLLQARPLQEDLALLNIVEETEGPEMARGIRAAAAEERLELKEMADTEG